MKNSYKIILIVCVAISLIAGSILAKDGERDEKVSKKKQQPKTEAVKETKLTTTTITPVINNTTTKTDNITPKAAAGETTTWQVISSGGGFGSSTNYTVNCTVGQTAVGIGSSANFILNSGYWQNFVLGPIGCCIGIRGNANGDTGDEFDISDVVYMVDWMFNDGEEPPCMDEVDVVIDDSPDIADLVYMVDYMFNDGDPLPPC